MAEEATGGFFVHSSACSVAIVLSLADVSDLWIASFRVHENQSAYACVWCHGIAVCQFDAEAWLVAITMLTCSVLMTVVCTLAVMVMSSAAAGAAVTVLMTVTIVMLVTLVSVAVCMIMVLLCWFVWVVQIGAFAEKAEDVLFERVVRAT